MAAGAILCGLGVVLGAMGTHVYGQVMNEVQLDIYKTGVLYQLFHGLALIATAMAVRQLSASRAAIVAGWLFLAGIPFFSFSLYLLAMFDLKFMGAVAPLGGSLLIAGWGCLFYAAQKGWRDASS